MLCSLSNFDAYHFTRAHRAPKPFAFAVKSTDKLSFFENTADYLHKFSCKEADGKIWMEKILIARVSTVVAYSKKTTHERSRSHTFSTKRDRFFSAQKFREATPLLRFPGPVLGRHLAPTHVLFNLLFQPFQLTLAPHNLWDVMTSSSLDRSYMAKCKTALLHFFYFSTSTQHQHQSFSTVSVSSISYHLPYLPGFAAVM